MFNNCVDAEAEFEKCWLDTRYTQITLNDIDVNKTLTHYITNKPIHFTNAMLWDMEKKKAWNPANYIPYVVQEGSAKSWNKTLCPITGGEIFVRESSQRQWLDPEVYEKIFEEVYVNETKQLVTFLGVKSLPNCMEELKPQQALFVSASKVRVKHIKVSQLLQ